MTELLRWAGMALCLIIILACACRVGLMSANHKRSWRLMYSLFACFAGGIALDLYHYIPVDWYTCLGIAGIVLNLLVTKPAWSAGAPAFTETQHEFREYD